MESIISIAESTLRTVTPLLLAALAGLFVERSGIIEISLEGKMLGAAFIAAVVAHTTGSPWIGVSCAILGALALAMLHGIVVIHYKGDQLIAGVAINFAVAGVTPVLALAWFGDETTTPRLEDAFRLKEIHLPGAEALSGVPVVGDVYTRLISGHSAITYLAMAIVPLVIWIVYKTRFGLRVRAAGSNPHALDTAGISVARTRFLALACGGVLCALAGSFISLSSNSGWVQNMTAGKGYLALAALVFGQWRPVPTVLVCFMFALTDAFQLRLQNVDLPVVGVIPSDFIQMLPYVLTVLLLAGVAGRAKAPKAIGVPFQKSR
ncbi:MAG TPA: ABC transporter permease [Burkholderiaceae bacterium]